MAKQAFKPEQYVTQNISKDDVMDLKRAFDIFDEDASGTIDPTELRVAFEELGFNTNQRMIYQVLGELDQNNQGGFTFNDFYKLAASRPNKQETKQEIQKAFNLFDYNREGRITWDELKKVALDLGEDVNDDQMKKMFAKADLDQDGFVNFEDFYNIMTGRVYFD